MKRFLRNRKFLALVAIIIVAAVGFYFVQNRDKSVVQTAPKATITKLKNKPANTTEKTPVSNTGTNKGNATSAPAPAAGDSSNWTTAEGGAITVHQPTRNGTFSPDAVLSGTSTLDKIQYRLIDSQKGVVSQGPIDVSDNKFSVSVHFQPSGTSGRLDVFSTKDDGTEINEVQIPVTF